MEEYREQLVDYLQEIGVKNFLIIPKDTKGSYTLRLFYEKEGQQETPLDMKELTSQMCMYIFADNPYLCFDLNIQWQRMMLDGVKSFDSEHHYRYIWDVQRPDSFKNLNDKHNQVYEVRFNRFRMSEGVEVVN